MRWLAALLAGCCGAIVPAQERTRAESAFALDDGTRVTLRDDGRWYRVVLPSGADSGWCSADPVVALRARRFDPLAAAVGATEVDAARVGGLRLVQCVTRLLPGYRAALAARGAEVLRVVPPQTVIVRCPDDPAPIRALPFVRWVGPYLPSDRLDPALADAPPSAMRELLAQLTTPGRAAQARVAGFVDDLDGSTAALAPDGYLLRVRLPPGALAALAAHDDVLWIEPDRRPRAYLDKVRVDGGADALEGVTGFAGQGVRGEVMDLGFEPGHPDLQAVPPLVHTGTGWWTIHGTEVSGIVFGTGATAPAARGLLPAGQAILSSYTLLTDRYQHTAELLLPPFEAVFQTNSWGYGPVPPGYPSRAFELDDVVFRHDLLTCQAMANQGTNVCEAMAYAKNVVSVGGIRHFDTLTTNDDAWQNAGSIGPCADGRVKPDLCHWYDSIHTITTSGGHTTNFGGTSAATPIVAGHFGMFFQMWHAEWFGNVAAGSTVFASRPHAATARAVLVNVAEPYAFSGVGHDLTRLHQGWGRAGVGSLLAGGRGVLVVDETRALAPFGVHGYSVIVPPGQPRLRATLAYTDPPGTSSAAVHRIVDLSLRVIAPDGTAYWGNHGLDVGNDSTGGGGPDPTNPVENVWLDAPLPGVWRVEVHGHDIAQDARPETPALDADYALVVSGIEPVVSELGGALAGGLGAPTLTASGFFVDGDRFRVDVAGAPAHASGALVLGDANVSLPLFGGVLVPSPLSVTTFAADGAGRASFAGVMAAPATAGTSVFVQVWLLDASGPQGFTASQGLEIRVP